jgi:hypothetical protein
LLDRQGAQPKDWVFAQQAVKLGKVRLDLVAASLPAVPSARGGIQNLLSHQVSPKTGALVPHVREVDPRKFPLGGVGAARFPALPLIGEKEVLKTPDRCIS